jgi:CRP-like cAMP-binding protein
MFKVVCHDLKDANAKLTNMAQKKVRDRLAETLLFLDETFGEDALGYLNIRLSREEIANVVGTATESVIRMLSEMNKEQLVLLFGKKIKLLNKKRLKRIAIGF